MRSEEELRGSTLIRPEGDPSLLQQFLKLLRGIPTLAAGAIQMLTDQMIEKHPPISQIDGDLRADQLSPKE